MEVSGSFVLPMVKPQTLSVFRTLLFPSHPHPIHQRILWLDVPNRPRTYPPPSSSSPTPGMSHHRVPVGHLQWPLAVLSPPALVLLQRAPCTAAGGIHSNPTHMGSLDATPLQRSVTFPAQSHLLHVTSGLCTPCCRLSSLPHSSAATLASFQVHRSACARSDPRASGVTFSGRPPHLQLHPSKSSGAFLLAYFRLSTAHSTP